MNKSIQFLAVLLTFLLIGCSEDEEITSTANIRLISATINGANIQDNLTDISTTASVVLTFDAAIAPTLFENALSITGGNRTISPQIAYQNASSRAVISLNLDFNTTYSFRLNSVPIGTENQQLTTDFTFQFTTLESNLITKQAPCGSASTDCTEALHLADDKRFELYSNYPIYQENASWEELTSAVIVIHGANRNSDDYFNWMTTSLENLSLDDKTVLIAPSFRIQSEATTSEIYWSNNNWREGQNAQNSSSISSFAIIDSLLNRLSNKTYFPVLEQIIITGHSSGGLFTHVYAAANRAETQNSDINFRYIVANSQYFYYPTSERINPTTGQLYTPTSCPVYNQWPLGFSNAPSYLSNTMQEEINAQFKDRAIAYLLGNGNDSDPSLNTTDCDAALLGASRFERGENMFDFMNLTYADSHQHTKHIVDGIGHDGQRMYQSEEFITLLSDYLGR